MKDKERRNSFKVPYGRQRNKKRIGECSNVQGRTFVLDTSYSRGWPCLEYVLNISM